MAAARSESLNAAFVSELGADLSTLENIKTAEVVHTLYQELSRCCVRNINQGRAQVAGFFLPSYEPDKIIEPLIGPDIFPGAELIHREELDDPKRLQAEKQRVEAAVRDTVARTILAVLVGLPADVGGISSMKLKPLVNEAMGGEGTKSTFTRARDAIRTEDLTVAGWELTRRGFKRINIDW